ncbi:ABC transporter substrate-binding protein [Nocardia sp. NBC_01730]|uniref:ABC transporter substrate-binding protein n=1 Tax=Nocardia sp. NBC_01730 TaxID=2975998 RepID=UPI002E15CEAE|nr:ABC transporter substrate-binding protein [Nocardia sp. NBC_01730]
MTVRLRQSVFVPPPLYVVADQRGFLAEAGVEVETTLTRSSDQQRAQLVAGDCDLAVTAIDNLIVWNATGASIRLLAQVERTTPLHLLGRKGFDTITALRGAELGVDAVDNGFAIVLRHLLRSHGLTSDDYTLTPVGGVRERYAALLAGAIAATLLGPPLDELARGQGLPVLLAIGDELPDYPGQGLVAGPAGLASAEAISTYLACLDRARHWLATAEPAHAVDLLIRGGYTELSARASLRSAPDSLTPAAAGLRRLYAIRTQLAMVPPGAPVVDELFEPAPLTSAVSP